MFLVWTGIRNVGVRDGLTALLHGQIPTEGPQTTTEVQDPATPADLAQAGALGAAIGAAGAADGNGHSVPDLQTYARSLLAAYGWSSQWSQFNSLVNSESGWAWDAVNPGGHGYNGEKHAYGIPQALPPSKMASAGSDWKTNGFTQLRWMMNYIHDRYGTPAAAWSYHLSHNYY
jgi:hypothetical protein